MCGAQLAILCDDELITIEVGDLEHRSRRPISRDTAFPIGSVTKSFTATLAMVLVADGDLDLDMPLRTLLPELDELADRLTLRHLLSHTGGLAGESGSAGAAVSSLRRYVADHCHRRNVVLPPGTGFSYSNIGYVVVGRLIEAVTGMSWAEAMESILLRPLGIVPAFVPAFASSFASSAESRAPAARSVATGHSVNVSLGRTQPVRQSIPAAEAPAGGLAVSALDLLALGRLHVEPGAPEILPPEHAEVMRRPVPAAAPVGLADGWGLGLAVFRGAGADWVGHDGNADGTACYLRVDPAGGRVVALTANTNTGIGMWREVRAVLSDAGIPLPSTTYGDVAGDHRPGRSSPDRAGTYANGDHEYVIGCSDGRWSLTANGADLALLMGTDDLTFTLLDRTSGQRLPGGRFLRDPVTGAVNGIMVGGRVAGRRTPDPQHPPAAL
ncbi:MAG TPA: serine hydrolase domain-containing protein [Streptosporangiaceae bacterium]|nr:serine hydrolase domain-containing protein [Streptosporangiaceae bacterium]